VMTMATERVGLSLPPPLPPRPISRLRQGSYGPVRPAQPAFVSPPLPDIWQCVEALWRQPLRTKAPVAGTSGILRVQGRPDTECPGVSPLDESLAAHLPPLSRDRDILEYLDKIFRLGTQMAATANNLGVLGVSLITPQQDTPALPPQDGSDYSDRCIGQMNNLIHGVAAAAGRVMSLATVASRHVWLGLTALSRKDREDLLGAPVSTEGLFGSITSVTQRFSRLEEERVQLSRMLPLALPRAPPQGRERGAKVRRRERRRCRDPRGSRCPLIHGDGLPDPGRPHLSRGPLGGVQRPPGAVWRGEEASRRREWFSPPRTRERIPPPPSLLQMW